MDIVVTVDGAEFKTTVHKNHSRWWTSLPYDTYGESVYIDLDRTYDHPTDEDKPTGWVARVDRSSKKHVPELADVVGTGKRMADALEVFWRPVAAAQKRKAEQAAFKREQLTTMIEICSCFDPHTALRLLQTVKEQIVVPCDWSEYHGGKLKDGRGRELFRVWVPVDGVACWEANKHHSDSHRTCASGYEEYVEEKTYDQEPRKAAVQRCREHAEAWLREQGVL